MEYRRIRDSSDLCGLLAEHVFETAAVRGGFGSSRKEFTGHHNGIGEQKAPFEKVHAPIKFQPRRRKVGSGEIREAEVRAPKIALKVQSMRAEHRPDRCARVPKKNRHQGGMPPVNVDEIRRGLQPAGQLGGGFRKKSKPGRVVLIITGFVAIKARAVKEFVASRKVDTSALLRLGFPNFATVPGHTQWDFKFDAGPLGTGSFTDPAGEGGYAVHLVPEPPESPCQLSDITSNRPLGEGINLACRHQDFHAVVLLSPHGPAVTRDFSRNAIYSPDHANRTAPTAMRAIVTCGPAHTLIDEVRRITNVSTGELGSLLSSALRSVGAEVLCLRGEGATFPAPPGVRVEPFGTNQSLEQILRREAGSWDCFFHAAALCDFEVSGPAAVKKIPSSTERLELVLQPAPKVLPLLRGLFPRARIVGWKYELDGDRDTAIARALTQIRDCSTDACVVNGSAYGPGFGFLLGGFSLRHFKTKADLCKFLAEWCPGTASSVP